MLQPKEITIDDDGQVLTFRISKIPATKMEKWMGKAVFLVGNSLPDVQDKDYFQALVKAVASIPFEKAEPLLDELFAYAERKMENGSYNAVNLATMDGYIQSPLTISKLRWEVLKHNLGFLPKDYQSKAESALHKSGIINAPTMQTSVNISPPA